MTDYDITPVPTRLAEPVQLRIVFSKGRGTITRFMVQFEYWLDEWVEIIRYDHDRDAAGGHDVTEDGLHRDVYRDGEKIETVQVTGHIPVNKGFNYAEDDLRENAERYCLAVFDRVAETDEDRTHHPHRLVGLTHVGVRARPIEG